MLQLTRRESLRVHVGEFLQLQRALQGDGEADMPAEEQHRPRVRHPPAQVADLVHSAQDGLDGRRHRFELGELARHLVGVLRAPSLGECQTHEVVRRHLSEERLRGRDPDLGPGVRVEHRVGLARDLGAVGVADRQHPGLLLPRVAHRLQRVGGLTGLRDGHHERVPVEHRVAVTELTRQLDLHREAGPVLDGVLGDEPGVVGGAAGDDEDLVDVPQILVGHALLVEHDAPGLEVPAQRVGERVRLLLDLLEHEVLVAALLGGGEVPVDRERFALGGLPVEVRDPVAVAVDHHELVLAEFDGLAGVLDEGRDVGRDERLPVTDTDHQR